METQIVVNKEFLDRNEACEWYRKFILETFPEGASVTKANVKKLLTAIKKAKDYNGKFYNLRTQLNILGTCFSFVLYKAKQVGSFNQVVYEKPTFSKLEKRFWSLWGKEKKQTAVEKWLEKINGTEIAGVPLSATITRGRVTRILLDGYSYGKSDMVQLMKLVKWDIPVKTGRQTKRRRT